jgi:hypothetical protein
MGKIADLCAEVAVEADETPEGLVLPPETLARLREAGWTDDDVCDALELVHATYIQNELTEAADSLSAHLVQLLGAFGQERSFRAATAGDARLSYEAIGQLTRRVRNLEHVLEPLREGSPVDHAAFEELERRLADGGMEDRPAPVPRRRTKRP